jgi:hypothetical protein
MPFLLIIPLMVWTLSGGQTRLRLWRHTRKGSANCQPLQGWIRRKRSIYLAMAYQCAYETQA